MNSGTVIGDKLYCAHSRYPSDRNNNTIEIWNVEKKKLEHIKTIKMPSKYGSITWADKGPDGMWWVCYAVYGKGKGKGKSKGKNEKTTLVKYDYDGQVFTEKRNWRFPAAVIANWGSMSCSGGSWGPDGYLYVTGHNHPRADVLQFTKEGTLLHVRTETGIDINGQAISWDRSDKRPVLWGIHKRKCITLTLFPKK